MSIQVEWQCCFFLFAYSLRAGGGGLVQKSTAVSATAGPGEQFDLVDNKFL